MISLWIGWPGTGKTTNMMDFVRQQAHVQRFMVVDRAFEWGAELEDGSPNPRWRGAPPKTLVEVPPNLRDSGEAPEWFEEQPETGVYLFRDPWNGHDVGGLCVQLGEAVYVDDEIDLAGTRSGWDHNPLRDIVHRGRHLINYAGERTQCHILGAARRPQSLHTDLSAIADQAFIFRVQGKLTLDRLRADSWIEDTEWDGIRNLPNLHYRHWPSGEYRVMEDPFKNKEKAK